jgi:thioredoxin reductase
VSISKSNQWFEEDKAIEFNESLVSVIGGKGSGKTAILDLIALATKSYRCYEDDEAKSKSFLKKALRELKGLKIKVEWDEGMPDEITVSDKIEESDEEGKVRYLPQDFIDQLCSEIGKSELEEQIENVIFQKIPPEYKADYADFSSYKEAQLSVVNERKDRISNQIEEVNKKNIRI